MSGHCRHTFTRQGFVDCVGKAGFGGHRKQSTFSCTKVTYWHSSVTQSIADAVRIKIDWVSDIVSQLEHLRPSGWDQTTKWVVPPTIVSKSRNLGERREKKSPAAQADTGMWGWGGSLRWLPLTSPCSESQNFWTQDTLEGEFGGRKRAEMWRVH